jgi:hypothetical protein
MAVDRVCTLLVLAAAGLRAQIDAPSFSRESVLPAAGKHAQSLMPGDLVSIYGQHLAPTGGCTSGPVPSAGGYPTIVCETEVTVNGVPAGLLAVMEKQINLKIPDGAPTSGDAPIVVTVCGTSSAPVMVPFGKPKVILSLTGLAYVHMPVWVNLNRRFPYYGTLYPYSLLPENFGGGTFEVKRNGVPEKPVRIPRDGEPVMVNGLLNGSIARAESPRGRLPLHLQYRFSEPGKYEIHFTGTRLEPDSQGRLRRVQVDESDWTEIEVLPYSDQQRRQWIREQVSKMSSAPGLLMGDVIPGLLAYPDELALSAILPELYNPDEQVRTFVATSIPMFDETLVTKALRPLIREKGPTPEIDGLLDRREDLFEGGHKAFLAALPRFLNSSSPIVEAGALQYLIWVQNHDWGKTPETLNQRSSIILNAAPAIFDRGDARLLQLLAEALGLIKADASPDLLWKMIESGKATEQSDIALTWIGDSRDLPRLAALLTKGDPADPYGRELSSLPYSLHRGYGDAALPWLKQGARDTKQIFVKTNCARELALANQPEGFQYLLEVSNARPQSKIEAIQFVRDSFPDLRSASEDRIVAFMRTKAGLP